MTHDGAPQTSTLHTSHSLTSCRACVTDTNPHTVIPLAQPQSPITAPPFCSHKPQSKCWFSPCESLGVSQSSGEEAAAGSAEPRHTPPLQHSPKDSHCPPLSPAIPAAARTRHRHSQRHGLTGRFTSLSSHHDCRRAKFRRGRDCRNRRARRTRLWLQHQRKVFPSRRGREDIDPPTGVGKSMGGFSAAPTGAGTGIDGRRSPRRPAAQPLPPALGTVRRAQTVSREEIAATPKPQAELLHLWHSPSNTECSRKQSWTQMPKRELPPPRKGNQCCCRECAVQAGPHSPRLHLPFPLHCTRGNNSIGGDIPGLVTPHEPGPHPPPEHETTVGGPPPHILPGSPNSESPGQL